MGKVVHYDRNTRLVDISYIDGLEEQIPYEKLKNYVESTPNQTSSGRSRLFRCSRDSGSIYVECDIQVSIEDRNVWYPEKPLPQKFLSQLYQNGTNNESSDVVFSVEGNIYHAHQLVLSLRCKKLTARGCQGNSKRFILPHHSDSIRAG